MRNGYTISRDRNSVKMTDTKPAFMFTFYVCLSIRHTVIRDDDE